jgi:DNA-binding PadR family transcriptional regulator
MKTNQTDYAILGLLAMDSPHSGYDLRKAVQNSIGYFWGESYGQIYPALKRLAADGLIKPVKQRPEGRKRQEYTITAAGRAELRKWLALPFHNDPPRNEFLLKLFLAGQADTAVAAAHVREVQERNRRMLGVLAEIEASVPKHSPANPNMRYWLLTLALGKALTEAALKWGESALAELEGGKTKPRNKRSVR